MTTATVALDWSGWFMELRIPFGSGSLALARRQAVRGLQFTMSNHSSPSCLVRQRGWGERKGVAGQVPAQLCGLQPRQLFPHHAQRCFQLFDGGLGQALAQGQLRSEEHSLNSSHVAISYAVSCLKK